MRLQYCRWRILNVCSMASDTQIDDLKRPTALFFLSFSPVNGRQFSLVANVVYPKLYQRFLDVITLANFDLGWIPSAACIMDVDFHVELIAATVGPLLLVASLGLTYTVALHRNRGSERAMSAVRRKHANATIVIALLLYSVASSAVFRAFACDPLDDGKVYLRSDYRIECSSPKHKAFQIYAAFMLVVYPLGIPTLFALLLFRNRKLLWTPHYEMTQETCFSSRPPTYGSRTSPQLSIMRWWSAAVVLCLQVL